MIINYAYDLQDEAIGMDNVFEEIEEEEKFIHTLISKQDPIGLSETSFEYFDFFIIEKTLLEALKEKGYQVERSSFSCSLYVQLNGKVIRISDHKRPAYDSGNGIFEEHEYGGEIISENRKVTKEQLESVGIYLPNDDYYLY